MSSSSTTTTTTTKTPPLAFSQWLALQKQLTKLAQDTIPTFSGCAVYIAGTDESLYYLGARLRSGPKFKENSEALTKLALGLGCPAGQFEVMANDIVAWRTEPPLDPPVEEKTQQVKKH